MKRAFKMWRKDRSWEYPGKWQVMYGNMFHRRYHIKERIEKKIEAKQAMRGILFQWTVARSLGPGRSARNAEKVNKFKLWHLRIHSETTEFCTLLICTTICFPTQERAELEAAKEELRQREAQQEFASVMDHGARVRKCALILSHILCFVFFRFFGGQGQICPDGRSAGPVSCVRKWNVRSVRNRRQRSSVSWCRSETFPGKLQTWELWDPKLFHVKLPIHVPTTRRIVDESCLKKGVPGCNGLTDGHFENRKPFLWGWLGQSVIPTLFMNYLVWIRIIKLSGWISQKVGTFCGR